MIMDPSTKRTASFSLSDWAFIEGALVAVEAIERRKSPERGWAIKDDLQKQLGGRALDLIKDDPSHPTAAAPR